MWLENMTMNVGKIPQKKEGQSLSCDIHIYFMYLFYMLRPKHRNKFLKINVEGQ